MQSARATEGRLPRVVFAALLASLTLACSGADDGPLATDARAELDAIEDRCLGAGPLMIGACVLQDGSPCTGVTDEDARFKPLEPSDLVDLIVGYQGATMLALAVRADGIHPGTEGGDDKPRIDIGLDNQAGQRLSSYFNAVAFETVNETRSQWLFVFLAVPGAGNELAGQTLSASGSVTDRDGQVRCGMIDLVAGSL